MDIRELFSLSRPVFSFEFFLPKIPENLPAFLRDIESFKFLNPAFVTLTYGAGGSSRDRTIEAAGLIKRETGFEVACHLTGISHTKREIADRLMRLKELGIGHLVALRGDIPKEEISPTNGGQAGAQGLSQRRSGTPLADGERRQDFPHAKDLIDFIHQSGAFQIAAAGYPETHPEAESPQSDIAALAEKMRAGADWVITQLFFDNKDYFDFVRRARAAGVLCPIVPGIMPVTNFLQLKRFASLCGTKIPEEMAADLEKIHADPEAVIRYGIDWATKQAMNLLANGAPGIHFFTLNRRRSTVDVLKNITGRF